MKVTIQQTEKLLNSNLDFSQLGFSMMLTRLKTVYAKEPTQEVLQNATSEINAFLDKFNMLMAKDYGIILKCKED